MSANGIFPEAKDDGCEPIRMLAERLGCSEGVILDCTHGLRPPEWLHPEHIDKTKEHTEALNKSLTAAKNLASCLSQLHEDDRDFLVQAGCVTRQQVEHLCDVLAKDVEYLERFVAQNPRPGGKNPAAYTVAKIVLRAFLALEKPITWGTCEGYPTTEYGKTVEYALAVFGVKSDWRRPAEAIRAEYLNRQITTPTPRTNSSTKK